MIAVLLLRAVVQPLQFTRPMLNRYKDVSGEILEQSNFIAVSKFNTPHKTSVGDHGSGHTPGQYYNDNCIFDRK